MKKGQEVNWNWAGSKAEGKIVKEYDEPVEKTIKGTKVKRNASKDEPAYEIKQANGSKVIKSESELKKGEIDLFMCHCSPKLVRYFVYFALLI